MEWCDTKEHSSIKMLNLEYHKMKKILIVAHNIRFIVQFELNDIKLLQNMGYEVHCAANYKEDHVIGNALEIMESANVKVNQIDCDRSPFRLMKNAKALRQLVRLLRAEKYDGVHCHTPMGGVLARLAASMVGVKPILYTAHGFHFFKGAPRINWLVYFPVEWLCSFMTDTLITINQEDYLFAKKYMHAKRVEYIPGVGIDLGRFEKKQAGENEQKRCELKVPADKVWVLTVGEMTKNKNHASLIQAVADIPQVYLTIAGTGEQQATLSHLIADLKLEDRVKLLGFRNDVPELCQAADLFAFPSFREGLSVALMEAMACGKPVVCSKIRGNIDLIDKNGGELFDPHDIEDIKQALQRMMKRNLEETGRYNVQKVKDYNVTNVREKVKEIYTTTIPKSV